jgi:hypothetical protein
LVMGWGLAPVFALVLVPQWAPPDLHR